jgi:hypothetical protein
MRHMKHISLFDYFMPHLLRIVCPVKAQVLFYCLDFCSWGRWCSLLRLDNCVINNTCCCLYVVSIGGCYYNWWWNPFFIGLKYAFLCPVCFYLRDCFRSSSPLQWRLYWYAVHGLPVPSDSLFVIICF